MTGPILKPQTKTVVLYQGDDLARIDELQEAVASAISQGKPEGDASATMDEADPSQDAAKAHDDFVTEAETRAVKIEVQVLGRRQWRSLVAEHPPRMETKTVPGEGDEPAKVTEVVHSDDATVGFNTESMADPLVAASVIGFDTSVDRDSFIDGLSDRNFMKVYGAAVYLNCGVIADPKADLSSRLHRRYVEISKLRDRSD